MIAAKFYYTNPIFSFNELNLLGSEYKMKIIL